MPDDPAHHAELVARAMAAHADRAVAVAQSRFAVALDRTAASIPALEALLARAATEIPRGLMRVVRRRPAAAPVGEFVAIFGAYLGEVLRGELGGRWSIVDRADGRQEAWLDLPAGLRVSPPDVVRNRLTVGAEHDVAHWYGVVVDRVRERRGAGFA